MVQDIDNAVKELMYMYETTKRSDSYKRNTIRSTVSLLESIKHKVNNNNTENAIKFLASELGGLFGNAKIVIYDDGKAFLCIKIDNFLIDFNVPEKQEDIKILTNSLRVLSKNINKISKVAT